MMEGQQGYEKHLWPPATKKRERKNEQSEQLKSGTKKCAPSEL